MAVSSFSGREETLGRSRTEERGFMPEESIFLEGVRGGGGGGDCAGEFGCDNGDCGDGGGVGGTTTSASLRSFWIFSA